MPSLRSWLLMVAGDESTWEEKPLALILRWAHSKVSTDQIPIPTLSLPPISDSTAKALLDLNLERGSALEREALSEAQLQNRRLKSEGAALQTELLGFLEKLRLRSPSPLLWQNPTPSLKPRPAL